MSFLSLNVALWCGRVAAMWGEDLRAIKECLIRATNVWERVALGDLSIHDSLAVVSWLSVSI